MKSFMMRAVLVAASVAGLAPVAAQATVFTGFTGPFATSTFNAAFAGNVGGGLIALTPTQVTLVGQDNPAIDPNSGVPACTNAITGFLGNCQVTFSHGEVGASDTVSFHWTYSTADITAGNDPFGVIVNGVATVLSDLGGPLSQSGNYTFTTGTGFAFFVNCTDCVGGAATASISNFQVAVVPEPGTVALGFIGAAILFTALRRRRDGVDWG